MGPPPRIATTFQCFAATKQRKIKTKEGMSEKKVMNERDSYLKIIIIQNKNNNNEKLKKNNNEEQNKAGC